MGQLVSALWLLGRGSLGGAVQRRAAPTPQGLGRRGHSRDGGSGGALGGSGGYRGVVGSSPLLGSWCLCCPHRAWGVSRGSLTPPELWPCPGVTPTHPMGPFPIAMGPPWRGRRCPHSFLTSGGQRAGVGGSLSPSRLYRAARGRAQAPARCHVPCRSGGNSCAGPAVTPWGVLGRIRGAALGGPFIPRDHGDGHRP